MAGTPGGLGSAGPRQVAGTSRVRRLLHSEAPAARDRLPALIRDPALQLPDRDEGAQRGAGLRFCRHGGHRGQGGRAAA